MESERVLVAAQYLHELHFSPEVEEVERQTAQNDEAQYEHVFRCARHARFDYRYGVALIAARLEVLQGEDDRVDEVHDDAGRQHCGAGQSVPVGSEQRADHVVSLRRDDRHNVHGHVEENKEHEDTPRYAHH